jgi:Txe/YoeB family toxin of Txe-Axe toxin-antitoxin module
MPCKCNYTPQFKRDVEDYKEYKERIERITEEICSNPPMANGKIPGRKDLWYRHFSRELDVVYKYKSCSVEFLLIRRRRG